MDCFRCLSPYANPHTDLILALPTPSSANYEIAKELHHLPDVCINQELKLTTNFVTNSNSALAIIQPNSSQFFYQENSGHTSYKTLKAYLASCSYSSDTPWGLEDPTNDHLLHLECRGIRRLQADNTHKRLPITINLSRT